MKTTKAKLPKGWSRIYRLDHGQYELVCPCGVGHFENGEVHGCCPKSCCGKPDFEKALAARGSL